MKILALDSSGLVASVAVVEDDNLLGEYTINYKKTHSQTLLPMLDEVAKMIELDLNTVDVIAVSAGPGSFTGLRIGASTAKGLAQGLDIPIVAVPTLEGLAYNLQGADSVVCAMMDARRNQAYYGVYDVKENTPQALVPQAAAPIGEVIEAVNKLGRPVIFVGDGVPVFKEQIEASLTVPYQWGADSVRYQKAASTAALGKIYLEQGKGTAARDFAPIYLRLSQAERERMEREKSDK